MSEALWMAIIASLPGLCATLGSIYLGRRQTLKAIDHTRQAVDGVHVLVNSQKDALTALLRQSLTEIAELTHENEDQRSTIGLLRQALAGRGAGEERANGAAHQTHP